MAQGSFMRSWMMSCAVVVRNCPGVVRFGGLIGLLMLASFCEVIPMFAHDPFAPPEVPVDVQCVHCGSCYRSDEMVSVGGLWHCKHYPECDGVGFRFDILEVRDGQTLAACGSCGPSELQVVMKYFGNLEPWPRGRDRVRDR